MAARHTPTAPLAPAASIAPRAMAASLLATVVSTAIGAVLVAAYLEATDPTPTSAGTNAFDLLKALGYGALGGLVAGLFVMLVGAWVAMLFRRRLWSGRKVARGWTLLFALVLWAVGVAVGAQILGVGGLGWSLYLVSLPALATALLLAWFLAPWVATPPTSVHAGSQQRRRKAHHS